MRREASLSTPPRCRLRNRQRCVPFERLVTTPAPEVGFRDALRGTSVIEGRIVSAGLARKDIP